MLCGKMRVFGLPILEAPMLDIAGLVAGYGEGTVLEHLSLTLRRGESLGIMGRNGVGKTSLLKSIMGLLPARSGDIRWLGESITRSEPFAIARRGIGYVPQGREIFSDLSVADNLRLAARGRPINAAFQFFPALAQKREALGGSLSGGQQQQLAIARVLIAEPKLLLLDEPSDGVQPSIVAEIGETLAAIRTERQIGMILVEQDIDLVLKLCDRVLVMEGGAFIAEHAAIALRLDPGLIERELAL
jgi:ABC-type branched-subunit amino acid transport system ATPase component